MSSEVNRLEELLKTFTPEQMRFIAVRANVRYDYQAAEVVGIAPETVSRWTNKSDVDEALKLMLQDGVKVALEILRRNVSKAAFELAEELDHAGVNVRHIAAIEILDRIMGKSQQALDVTSGGEKVRFVEVVRSEDGA